MTINKAQKRERNTNLYQVQASATEKRKAQRENTREKRGSGTDKNDHKLQKKLRHKK